MSESNSNEPWSEKILALKTYFTKSAKLNACNGLLARLATSSSAIVVELGGCDHS